MDSTPRVRPRAIVFRRRRRVSRHHRGQIFHGTKFCHYRKVPLEWIIGLADDYTLREHLEFVGRELPLNRLRTGLDDSYYSVRFRDEEQERELLLLIRRDPHVVKVSPNRAMIGIDYMIGKPPQERSSHQVSTFDRFVLDAVLTLSRNCDWGDHRISGWSESIGWKLLRSVLRRMTI